MIGVLATASVIAQGPLMPAWIVLPLAMIAMLVLASYHEALRAADIPESRRRIRIANTMVMLVAVPLAAYSFAIASPDEPRVFVLVWTSVLALLLATVLLAMLDVLNSLRLHRGDLRNLRAHANAAHHELLDLARVRADDGADG